MADPYQEALSTLISLGAERALLLQGPAPFQPRLMHGFEDGVNWSDQVSLGMLERPLQGEPLLLVDIGESELVERWSVEVSGIRSVICVPFWSPSSRILGLLYADTRCLSKAFTAATMTAMQNCARRLERALYGGPEPAPIARPAPAPSMAPAAQKGRRLGLKRELDAAASPPLPTKPQPVQRRAAGLSLAIFLRSLSTLVSSGVGIQRGLDVLGRYESDPVLRQAARRISQQVQAGQTLSASLARHPHLFQRFDCALIEVGEKSGTLDRVLHELASFREKMMRAQMQLQSALTYPILLSLLSLAAVVLAPPLVLRGQFEMLRQTGLNPPWATRLMMSASDFLVSPPGWGSLLLGTAGILWLGRARPLWRERLWSQAARLPVLKRLNSHFCSARFARGLSLTYRVGIPISQCLELAAKMAGSAELNRDLPEALEALNGGRPIAEVVSQISLLPANFAAMVKAGEESGKLDATLEWIARFYESEFENNLETALSLIQPLLILTMGFLVGGVLLATLLPMVHLVQQL